jgi:SOS response regulatory protein OraA/RecX
MNYITEINAFYDWLETNSISDSAINLWHAMMAINNKTGWKKEFTVAILTLEGRTKLSKSSIIRARNQLKQSGRIDFKERKGNQSCVYNLIAFHTDTQSGTQSVTQTDTQYGTQSDTITKLKETKLNKTSLLEKETKANFSFRNELLKKGGLEKLVDDWLKVRKTKKATNSETAFAGFIKQVEVSKKEINDVLTICIEKDWKGFNASWLNNNQNLQNGKQYSSSGGANTNQGYKPASVNTEELVRELANDFEVGNVPGQY